MASLTRGVPAAMLSAIQAGGFHPVTLVDLDWPTGRTRVHSGVGTITYAGNAFTGIGPYGRVVVPGEGMGLPVAKAVLTLLWSGDEILVEAQRNVRNREGLIHVALTTERAGTTLVSDPGVEVYSGYMDALRFRAEPDGAGVIEEGLQLTLNSGPSARAIGSVFHSYERQLQDHPGDTAGRWLIEIEKRVQSLGR